MNEQSESRQSIEHARLIAKLDSLAEAILRLAISNERLVAAMAESEDEDYDSPVYLDGSR